MKSPLAYIGEKSKLAQSIIDLIPKHKTYCEVFSSVALVFFNKELSRYGILNEHPTSGKSVFSYGLGRLNPHPKIFFLEKTIKTY